MASKGRGSAEKAAVAAMLLLVLLVQSEMCSARVYSVGGASGWTFSMAKWPRGKTFKAGDVLVFKYSPQFHNLVAVGRAGYKACSTPRGSKTSQTGKDAIKLKRGMNFFICSIPGHCQSGMKMAIKAL